MKQLHLVCNAHIDPCWQWDVEEGIACALSTFRCAADFCEKYDGLIFNHNEALLYQWVESYEPELFERIKKLVRLGKWHIMGGWYLQPDCNLVSGEAFVRHILKGRIYFKEKFGAEPKTAMNVDSFGHTRGLVQILKKSGYDSYIFCRPFQKNMPLEKDDFIWRGYDGSEIRAFRTYGIYNSLYGMAAKKIEEWLSAFPQKETGCIFWGVGDHGGGPSTVDLDAIAALQEERKDIEIIHSTPEAYFERKVMEHEKLPVWDKGLNHWGPGCYTSMARVKQLHRHLEADYFMAEKMAVHACLTAGMSYPKEKLHEALEALLFSEFHDILPGSAIRQVEESAIRKMDYGLEILSRIKAQCFFRLCAGQAKAKDGEIPILIYNPHPYVVEGIFECEFMLANMNVSGTFMNPVVYQGNKRLPSQCEKEGSNFPMDWRKRVVFKAALLPGCINRFDCRLEVLESDVSRAGLDILALADSFLKPDGKHEFHVKNMELPLKMPFGKPKGLLQAEDGFINFSSKNYDIKINTNTGLIDALSYKGKRIFGEHTCQPVVLKDTMDSWAAADSCFKEKKGAFLPASKALSSQMAGTRQTVEAVRIAEDGEVRTVIEVSMHYGQSLLTMIYKLPKDDSKIEVEVHVLWAEKDTMLKIALPAAFHPNACYAQTSYGSESVLMDGHEAYMQQWCALYGTDTAAAVMNDGIYGFSCESGVIYLTLLRSPAYAAHPSPAPEIYCEADYRYIQRMDQGERTFRFWLLAGEADEIQRMVSRKAQPLNEKPYILSFFPEGAGKAVLPLIELSENTSVLCSAFKMAEDGRGYILRLFEASGQTAETEVAIPALGIAQSLKFKPYEIITCRCQAHKLEVCPLMEE